MQIKTIKEMNSDLRDILSNYFNNSLKQSLNYRENYSTPIYIPTEGIIVFNNLTQFDDLKNILISSPQTVTRLKETLFVALFPYFDNLEGIELLFNEREFGIILERGKYTSLSIDPYVNLAGNFDTVEQLDNFCRSTKETLGICRTNEFWVNLVKRIYPEKYKGEYNYEKVYKGYLIFNNPSENANIGASGRLDEYIKFVTDEGFVPDDKLYRRLLLVSVYLGDERLFYRVINYYGKWQKSDAASDHVTDDFKEAVTKGDIKYVTNYVRMASLGSINFLDGITGPEVIWSTKIWRLVYNKMYDLITNSPVDVSRHYKNIISHFNNMVIINAITHNDTDLLDQVFKTGRYSDRSVINFIVMYIRGHNNLPPFERTPSAQIMKLIEQNMRDDFLDEFIEETHAVEFEPRRT